MTGTKRLLAALQLRWLGMNRIGPYGLLLALASAASLPWAYGQATGPGGSDFLAFWSAGRLVEQGRAAQVYDLPATYAVQATLAPISRDHTAHKEAFAFVNPPPFLLAVAPLGWLSYRQAVIAWVVVGYGLWFAAARRWASEFAGPVLGFPGALIAAWHAQTGLLLGAAQVAMANLLRERPLLAGVAIGVLVAKPHLGLLIPVALVAGRQWRALIGAALTVPALIALAWMVFGTRTLLNYSHSWPVSQGLMDSGGADFFLRQTTVYAAVRVAWSAHAGAVAQALVSAGVAALVWRAWRGAAPLEGKLALLLAAVPLASPYMFSYDLAFLVAPICWLARQVRLNPLGPWDRTMVLGFYLSPLVTRALALPLHVNVMPWILMGLVWAIWRRLQPGARASER